MFLHLTMNLRWPASSAFIPTAGSGSSAWGGGRRAGGRWQAEQQGRAAGKAVSRASDGGAVGDGGSETAHPGWEPACAGFLAQALDVSSAEAAGWLNKAARKLEQAAAKQPQGAAPQPQPSATIRLAEVQQLVEVILNGVIGMPKASMVTMLRKWPRYLASKPAQPLGVANFLREEVGVTESRAGCLLRLAPQLLGTSVEVLRQRSKALQCALGLSDAQLARIIHRRPDVLGRSVSGIDQQYPALLEWCRDCGWTSDQFIKMVTARPRILSSPVPTLQNNFALMMEVCRLSQRQTVDAMCSQPNLLHRTIATPEKIRKLDFLQQVIGRPMADLAQVRSYIDCSLPDRIAPRTYFRLARGKKLGPTLGYLREGWPEFYKACGCTEAEYEEWLAAWQQTPEGRKWGAKAGPA